MLKVVVIKQPGQLFWWPQSTYWKPWVSLVPSPSPHVRERESGVLSDFSCHSSPIRELESDLRTRNYMWWRSNRARDLVCLQCMGNVMIIHSLPRPMWQEMSLKTPDPLSAFRGRGLGTRLALGVPVFTLQQESWITVHKTVVLSQRAAWCGLYNSLGLPSLESFSLFWDILGEWT